MRTSYDEHYQLWIVTRKLEIFDYCKTAYLQNKVEHEPEASVDWYTWIDTWTTSYYYLIIDNKSFVQDLIFERLKAVLRTNLYTTSHRNKTGSWKTRKIFETKGLSSTCFNLLLTQSHSKYCQNEDLFIIYDMSHVRNTSSSSHKYQSRIRVEWNRMGLEGWSRGKNKLFLCNGRIFIRTMIYM